MVLRPSILLALAWFVVGTAASAQEIHEAQLAGKQLPAYPFFQHVRNVNSDEPVTVGIDPSRAPWLGSTVCEIFVVAAKSAQGWAADPTLSDVTSGGAGIHQFGGSTIQQNTVVVAVAGELSGDAGIGLGLGYDVVLDCNRNGLLDDGDVIDGLHDEPGFFIVHDTTLPGPLATSLFAWNGGPMRSQWIYYPTDIASLGQLPLVVVSHGWTLQLSNYSYIGNHLASYGYIVMTHENDVGGGGPGGTLTAAVSTLENIDLLLDWEDDLNLGSFAGHIDSSRITMIGHSTGGEGVIRAVHLLREGGHPVQHFSLEDIALLLPIAPVCWFERETADPGAVNFHMFAGAADSDVANTPVPPGYTQLMAFLERSTGNKSLVYIHGAGHSYFDEAGLWPWAEGPRLIGHAATRSITKGYLLPLLEYYVRGNLAGKDYLTRMYDDFRPSGIEEGFTVVKEYRDAEAIPRFVIDDFQTQASPAVSSSGGTVTLNVSHVREVLMKDTDGSFDWDPAQPSNGMTRVPFATDDARGVVFDWAAGQTGSYELQIIPTQRDFNAHGFLSFRVCQGTRHPETLALNGPLTLTATLRDGTGAVSSIHSGNYGQVASPYARTGYGDDAGWANEFNTVRIPLADFTNNGSGLALDDVVALRFDVGTGFGSSRGRIGLDDIELTDARPLPFMITLGQASGTTQIVWPQHPVALDFNVYRGTIPSQGFAGRGMGLAVYDHLCFESGDAQLNGIFASSDPANVLPGTAGFYYLVGVVTSGGETLGEASVDLDAASPGAQRQRPNSYPCP